MTIIAWDGKTLAADKASTIVGYSGVVTKIFRVPGGLVGFAGNGDAAMALLEWFRNGRDVAAWPEWQRIEERRASAMFIDREGRVLGYGSTPYPEHDEALYHATGSGRDYALAVMHLGFDARRAVEVACELDNDCGRGIDTLTLE